MSHAGPISILKVFLKNIFVTRILSLYQLMRGRGKDALAQLTNIILFAALRPGSLCETGREGSQVEIIHGRTNMRFSYPETGGISQSQRAVGKPRNLHN